MISCYSKLFPVPITCFVSTIVENKPRIHTHATYGCSFDPFAIWNMEPHWDHLWLSNVWPRSQRTFTDFVDRDMIAWWIALMGINIPMWARVSITFLDVLHKWRNISMMHWLSGLCFVWWYWWQQLVSANCVNICMACWVTQRDGLMTLMITSHLQYYCACMHPDHQWSSQWFPQGQDLQNDPTIIMCYWNNTKQCEYLLSIDSLPSLVTVAELVDKCFVPGPMERLKKIELWTFSKLLYRLD